MIYSTYLATCRQLDVPRCLMLYFQYVSATFSVISVRNHSQTSPRLSRFQLSEARFITSINIICLSPHKPPFTRSLTVCWDSNWPRRLLAAFKILLLIKYSHQELVEAQFCFDLLCTRHYSTDCITFDKCTFQRVGVGWVGSENVTDILGPVYKEEGLP